ncbi:MAG: hypothetical protein V4685_02570 [Bacteroidota bacterium]
MNINRNNYEEYFLLYIDNELCVADKKMVEAFVASNPDLGEELVMLQQSIVKPGTVEFAGKEKLLKSQTINAAIEEKLLLLLDNELPKNEKKEILQLVANDISVKEEWELLQQTKLSAADKITFEDKPLLYLKETKVIPFAWWRMAAAAVLIGFGLWGGISFFNKDGQHISPGTVTVKTSPEKELPSNTTNNNTIPAVTNDSKNETLVASEADNNIKTTTAEKGTSNTSKLQTATQPKDNNVVVNNTPNKEDSNKDDLENINNEERNKRIFVNVSPETNINKTGSNVEITSSPKNENAITASFNNSTAQEYASFEEENDEDKPRKTKLGGFFKKVKRQLERKTKIKTGSDDEVRIANMSFAMH